MSGRLQAWTARPSDGLARELMRFTSMDDVAYYRRTDPEQVARNARHAAIDEQARRISVWIGIQAAADRAHFAGKSRTRSLGQLNRWRAGG